MGHFSLRKCFYLSCLTVKHSIPFLKQKGSQISTNISRYNFIKLGGAMQIIPRPANG